MDLNEAEDTEAGPAEAAAPPPGLAEELAARIAGEERFEPLPILLSGEPGAGRGRLLRAAYSLAVSRGVRTRLAILDLDGYEPDGGGLAGYLAHRLRGAEPGRRESLGRLLGVAPAAADAPAGPVPVSSSVWLAALLSIGLSIHQPDLPADRLGRMLAGEDAGEADAASPRSSADLLARALDGLCAEERLVLHVPEAEALTAPLALFLLDRAAADPRFVLVLSCRPATPTDRLAPGRQVARAELAPPTSAPVAGGGADPIDPLQTLHAAFDALPPERRDPLWSWLACAVRCGPRVPARPLLAALGLPEEELEETEDSIDEMLVDDPARALFREAVFDHPSFPGLATYELASPRLAAAVRRQVPPDDSRRLAREMLVRLPGHLPPGRGAAALLLRLAEAAEDPDAVESVARQLAWRIGPDEFEELRAHLAGELRAGRLHPDLPWGVAGSTHGAWPPFRRLALLDALAMVAEAREEGEGESPLENPGPLAFLRGEALAELGEWRAAREAFDRAAERLDARLGEGHELATSLQRAGVMALMGGDLAGARERLGEAVGLFERLGEQDYDGLGLALKPLAQVELALGETESARRITFRALALAEREDTPQAWLGRGSLLSFAGGLCLAEGKADEALAHAAEALPILEQLAALAGERWRELVAGCLTTMGSALARLGRDEEARAALEQALATLGGEGAERAQAIRVQLAQLGPA